MVDSKNSKKAQQNSTSTLPQEIVQLERLVAKGNYASARELTKTLSPELKKHAHVRGLIQRYRVHPLQLAAVLGTICIVLTVAFFTTHTH